MKRRFALLLILASVFCPAFSQAPGSPPKPSQQDEPADIIRITTNLVQTDVVVTDKNERPITDLSLEDFELYDNGKKQNLKFLEFVSSETGTRTEGQRPAGLPFDADLPKNLSAKDLKRVVAFVIDDLTISSEDIASIKQLLLNFVNNDMKDGDLVAVVRVVGGKGLLQQFTSDRRLLRRAISLLNAQTHPFSAVKDQTYTKVANPVSAQGSSDLVQQTDANMEDPGQPIDLNDPNDENQRLFRGLVALTTANFVVDSLKGVPGRKNLFLISGGIPIFETASTGSAYSNITYLLHQLEDNAVRAAVVINTLDPRGLRASAGVVSFKDTPGRSALASPDPNFGRGGSTAGRLDTPNPNNLTNQNDDVFGPLLAGPSEHLGLDTVAKVTGGVSVVNTNNFKGGVDKALARGGGYYLLAYTPSEKFDNKFHSIEIRVRQPGARVYAHRGYVARSAESANAPRSKEESIMAAAKSPLAKRDLDVDANIILKPAVNNRTTVGIHLLIDANRLHFIQTPDGKYQNSFDIVGFVYDQLGKLRGGFSETINSDLSPDEYQQALHAGLTYSANTELPPGYFQVRAAVREAATGNLGTISRYLEIPNLSNGRLTMSSIFLFAASPTDSNAVPTPLLAARQLSHNQDLRYAASIFNVRSSGSKQQVLARMVISQGSKVLFQEPDQPIESRMSPVTKIGQLALSRVPPGHYVLTLIVTDPLADKKSQMVARSIDFTVN